MIAVAIRSLVAVAGFVLAHAVGRGARARPTIGALRALGFARVPRVHAPDTRRTRGFEAVRLIEAADAALIVHGARSHARAAACRRGGCAHPVVKRALHAHRFARVPRIHAPVGTRRAHGFDAVRLAIKGALVVLGARNHARAAARARPAVGAHRAHGFARVPRVYAPATRGARGIDAVRPAGAALIVFGARTRGRRADVGVIQT